MGDDFDFRTMLTERPRRRRSNVVPFRRPTRRARFRKPNKRFGIGPLVAVGLIIGGIVGWTALPLGDKPPTWPVVAPNPSLGIGCMNPKVLDGDTLRCGSTRIRLSAIDAPELPGHCRPGRDCTPGDPYASTENLRSLVSGQAIECSQTDTDHYGRVVARCSVQGQDLSCAQYQGGFAIQRYGLLSC